MSVFPSKSPPKQVIARINRSIITQSATEGVAAMRDPFLVLVVIVVYAVFWALIFSKAGYSGWLGLLMLVPVVNLIWLVVFVFSEWPIQTELARYRGEKPKIPEVASGSITEWLATDPSVPVMFSTADKLDQRGDWADAIAVYEQIAERRKGRQDGEYARNCADEICLKMKMAKGA
jgi:hypothetical protein